MQTLQEYKCPCCGGAIAFDSTLQKMKCPFCGTEFEMDALKSYDAELQGEQADNMEWETSAGSEWQESEIEVFPKQKDIKKQPMFTCLQTKEYCY